MKHLYPRAAGAAHFYPTTVVGYLCLLLALLLPGAARAQTPAFSTSRSTGSTYTSIGTTGTSFTFQGISTDDNTSTSVALPADFAFSYLGTPVTSFQACLNGWIALNSATTNISFTNELAGSNSLPLLLAPMWDDLVCQGHIYGTASLDASMKYLVSGTAPNRVLTVEWLGMEVFSNDGPNLNFQVKLYETSNIIQYQYGVMSGFDGRRDFTYTYSLGLTGSTPAGSYLAQQSSNSNFFAQANADVNDSGANALAMVPTSFSQVQFVPAASFSTGSPPTAVVPANNNPAGAFALPLLFFSPTSFATTYTSANATASSGITACTAATPGTPDDDVWFTFTLSRTQPVTVTLRGSGGYDGVLQVFSNAGTTALACVNDTGTGLTENYSATLAAGTYYVRVYSADVGWGTTGQFALAAYVVPPAPANNECAAAVALSSAGTCTPINGTSLGATASAGVPACTGTPDDDVWYSFTTAATARSYTLTMQGSVDYDGVVQVLSGACGSLTSVSCTNATLSGGAEVVTLSSLTPNTTYYVRVYESASGYSSGDFTLCLTDNFPRLTSVAPTSGPVGTSVTLRGTGFTGATGVSFNGTAATIFGVTNSTTATATVPAGAATGNVTLTTPLGTSNGQAFTVLSTVASITRQMPSPTATATVQYRVVFSTSVTGLTVSNFGITPTGISGAGVISVSGSGTTYTVNVNTGTGNGTLRLNVANSTGISPAVSGLPYTAGEAYTITKSFSAAPILRIQGVGGSGGDVTAFVDAVQVLSGGAPFANALQNGSFETHDPYNNGGNTFAYSPTGASWSFNSVSGIADAGSAFSPVTPVPSGIAVGVVQSNLGINGLLQQNLAVPTGSYQVSFLAAQRVCCSTTDQALNVFLNGVFIGSIQPPNNNAYSPFTSATFSVTAPALTATVSSTAGASGSSTGTTPIPFSVNFSQSVGTSFTAADLTVGNGSVVAGSFSGSGAGPYTFTVTPTTPGTATTVSLAAGVAQDANNAGNAAAGPFSITYRAAPVLTGLAPNSAPVGTSITLTGLNLAGTTGVSFNGTAASIITVVSNTTVTATVPAGATTGSVTLTTPGGTSNGLAFTVCVPPVSVAQNLSVSLDVNGIATVAASAVNSGSTANCGTAAAGSLSLAEATSRVTNGTFDTNATGWTATNVDNNGGYFASGGNPGGMFILNDAGSPGTDPTLSQTVTGLMSGATYVLRGNYRSNYIVGTLGAPALAVDLNGSQLTTFPAVGTTWTPFSLTFTATVASQTLAFRGEINGTDVDIALDNLRLTQEGSTLRFSCASTGVNPVRLSVTDAGGTVATAVATVTVSVPATPTTTWNGAATTAWTDCGNWSFGKVPDATTNVVVPAGLSRYPNLTTGTLTVKDLTIDASGSFTLSSGATLQVNGNLTNNGTATFSGAVAFVGSAATQTLSNNGGFTTVTVTKPVGTVQLGRNLTINSALTLSSGTLTTTGAYQVNLGGSATLSESETSYVLGKVAVNRTLVPGTAQTFGGLGLTLTPAAGSVAPGATAVSRTTGTALTGTGTSVSIQRYFDIQPAVNTGLNVTMNFVYFDHELNGITTANLAMFKSETSLAGPWANQSPITQGLNQVTKTGIADFSIWTLGSSANPLPVELTAFTATAAGPQAVRLAWTTATEVNSAAFGVERSPDGVTFRTVGTVPAAGTSTAPRAYTLLDQQLPAGVPVLYYRLQQLDQDGTFSYSPVRAVALSNVAPTRLTLAPNPTTGAATLRGAAAHAPVQIYDAVGRLVLTATADATGTAHLVLPTGQPLGVYVVRTGGQATRLVLE
ncbi:beta strand repeat-containing protein [Hymenobacter canadensis]|uniref:IPT/TIG domain-containing protein n=1 Tax=Hymenobacter canadensis TaxID=2999067 RepID=A0ABY7LLZ6_9BACT|nr:pre-peptidase C-terminal domain-containing protein [Hymenobacter canadensis]WBA41479.1 hypothetical protein O3303_16890 [Hymenobacter canadensis]